MSDRKIVAVSGGCDIIKCGFIRMLKEANKYGRVVVILNSDKWLEREKGWILFNWEQRKEVLLALKYVDDVVPVDDLQGGSISEALQTLRPDYYATGHTREEGIIEADLCQQLGIEVLYGIGGSYIDKSTKQLIDDVVIKIIDKLTGWLRKGEK